MKPLRRMMGLFSILCFLALEISCRKDDASVPILGVVLPLTGGEAYMGSAARQGVELALSEVNSAGGIRGNRIQAVYADSQGTPPGAVTALRSLLREHRVQAVVGDLSSGPTLSMSPILEAERIALVTPTASAPAKYWTGRHVFRLTRSDRVEAEAAARWAVSQRLDRAALLYSSQDAGFELADGFRSAYQASGGQVIADEQLSSTEPDFRLLLSSIWAKRPELVYLAVDGPQGGRLLRQAQELGLSGRFITSGSATVPSLLQVAGAAAEGLVIVTFPDFDRESQTPAKRSFAARFRQRFGAEPEWFSASAYDSTKVVLEALRSGARTGQEICDFLHRKLELQGVTGRIMFDENGENAAMQPTVKVARDGRLFSLAEIPMTQ